MGVCMLACARVDHGGLGVGSSEAGVPGSCDLTNIGAGAHTQLLHKQYVLSMC